jgi:four helix bundle protein
MSQHSDHLKQRTLVFGVNVLRLVDGLPSTLAGQTVGRQLARSGPSIGANYRAACSARSRVEFIAKLGVVVEEAEESVYWLDVILDTQLMEETVARAVRQEAGELLAIFARSIGTARTNAKIGRKEQAFWPRPRAHR